MASSKSTPTSSGGSKASAFNGTKTPPSGSATRKIPIYPDTTGDAEARRTLRADVSTNRVAPPKTVRTPSSTSTVGRQVTGRKAAGGTRLSGGSA